MAEMGFDKKRTKNTALNIFLSTQMLKYIQMIQIRMFFLQNHLQHN